MGNMVKIAEIEEMKRNELIVELVENIIDYQQLYAK